MTKELPRTNFREGEGLKMIRGEVWVDAVESKGSSQQNTSDDQRDRETERQRDRERERNDSKNNKKIQHFTKN